MAVKPKFYILLQLAGMLLAAVLSYALLSSSQPAPTENMKTRMQLPAVTVYTESGTAVSTEDFRGEVLLVNLWAIWCPPCIAELPDLDTLQVRLKDKGVRVVAIAMGKNSAEEVRQFFDEKNIGHLEIYTDSDRQVVKRWPNSGIPESLLFDRRGNLIERFQGIRNWDSPEMVEKVRALTEQ